MASPNDNTKKFQYSDDDFSHTVPKWAHYDDIIASKFDALLCETWDNAKDKGYFRYKLNELQTRIIPGKYGFVAQLNVKRAQERRKPQSITSVSQPFNPSEFNFTKVLQQEILFQFEKVNLEEHRGSHNSVWNGSDEENVSDKRGRHLIIINISPLEYGNSLVVPFVDSCLPQLLSKEGIKIGLELILLSSTPAFRVGFNSLCANASVNHHHLHVYYLKQKLLLETIQVCPLVGNCYELRDYPAAGFAFQLTSSDDVNALSETVFKVSSYLHSHGVPQNLFMTRGSNFKSKVSAHDYDNVRIFLWARKPTYGIKDDAMFNVACCELAGHIPVKHAASFEAFTEKEICDELRDCCTAPFEAVKLNIVNFLSQ